MHPCQGACRSSSSKWHKLILHGLGFLRELYLVGTRGFFHVLADCLLLAFFGLPLDFQWKIVAWLQLFFLLFRLCLCDLAWLIFHATALRKYLSTSSTVKTSSTSTYDTILWDQVEQGVLTLFAGLQRITFLLHLEFLAHASRDEEEGECIAHSCGMVKKIDLEEALINEGTGKQNWTAQASISFQQFTVFINSLPQILCAKFDLRWSLVEQYAICMDNLQ